MRVHHIQDNARPYSSGEEAGTDATARFACIAGRVRALKMVFSEDASGRRAGSTGCGVLLGAVVPAELRATHVCAQQQQQKVELVGGYRAGLTIFTRPHPGTLAHVRTSRSIHAT